ncbi:hypothetical protein FACS1894193_00560 [Bacilli bacterium]|nr:hypothetical protein FACS1894193_00560 [Bacilli bacterium]
MNEVEYYVYNINEKVEPIEDLTDEKIQNIENIFRKNTESASKDEVTYSIPKDKLDSHLLIKYSQMDKNYQENARTFADDLLLAEHVKDGSKRNKQITQGFLFFKYTPTSLLIVKLEDEAGIDKETFAEIDKLGIRREFCKVCIYQRNQNTSIKVIDKNIKIAEYWSTKFLKLERTRDNFVNTENILKVFESHKNDFFSQEIYDREDSNEIKKRAREYFLASQKFDKENLFQNLQLNDENLSSDNFLQKKLFKDIDSSFFIDKKAINKQYKRNFAISDRTKINTKNIAQEISDGVIEFKEDEGKVSVQVSTDNLPDVKRLFKANGG